MQSLTLFLDQYFSDKCFEYSCFFSDKQVPHSSKKKKKNLQYPNWTCVVEVGERRSCFTGFE